MKFGEIAVERRGWRHSGPFGLASRRGVQEGPGDRRRTMWRCSGLPASSGSSRPGSMPTTCRRTTPPRRWRRRSPGPAPRRRSHSPAGPTSMPPSPGVAVIDADRVRALNRLHESLTLATVAPFETVARRQLLATVKVIPFAVPKPILDAGAGADRRRAAGHAQALHGAARRARHHRACRRPSLRSCASRSWPSRERLQALGSTLGEVVLCRHETAEVAAAITRLKAGGHDPVLVFGASAIVDRGDVVPAGLVGRRRHASFISACRSTPAICMMLGRLADTPVIGVPSCARSPKVNGFDWVLARILAGIAVTGRDIMDMGAGGLLKEIPSRPAPRDMPPAAASGADHRGGAAGGRRIAAHGRPQQAPGADRQRRANDPGDGARRWSRRGSGRSSW